MFAKTESEVNPERPPAPRIKGHPAAVGMESWSVLLPPGVEKAQDTMGPVAVGTALPVPRQGTGGWDGVIPSLHKLPSAEAHTSLCAVTEGSGFFPSSTFPVSCEPISSGHPERCRQACQQKGLEKWFLNFQAPHSENPEGGRTAARGPTVETAPRFQGQACLVAILELGAQVGILSFFPLPFIFFEGLLRAVGRALRTEQ